MKYRRPEAQFVVATERDGSVHLTREQALELLEFNSSLRTEPMPGIDEMRAFLKRAGVGQSMEWMGAIIVRAH
ncbi:MAG TPA: hypothetical protein DCY89_05675 [Gammaproteobacteria bacterium]|nr:hypothetical protein [Gammaproteobacteria bacterium]